MNKTIKKILTITAVVLIAMPLFNGCKKGDEDPFLSLSSRNKRITGTWKLVKYERTMTNTTVNSTTGSTTINISTDVDSYDGSNYTEAEYTSYNDGTGGAISYTSDIDVTSYSLEVIINKDNTTSYSKTETEVSDCNTNTQTCVPVTESSPSTLSNNGEGTWYWYDSKDKKVYISASSLLEGNIKQLKNKELILEDSYKSESKSSSSGYTFTSTYEYTETSTWEKQ